MTVPPNLNILAPIPVTKPSLLASKALEVILLANPVIGIKVPAPAFFPIRSYYPNPVKIAAAKKIVIIIIGVASFSLTSKIYM